MFLKGNTLVRISIIALIFCLSGWVMKAQEKSEMSIAEIHTLVEKMINYSPDSSLILLDLAANRIGQVEDKDLASSYWAVNNLRRADYWLFDDTKKSKSYLKKARNYYSKNVDNKKLAEVFCLEAQIIKIQGEMEIGAIQKSIPYFDKALSYALKQDNPGTTAFIYYEKAFTLQQTERWQESYESALQGIHYAELSGDSLSIAMAYFLMGRTYDYFGFSEYSESYFSKAVTFGEGVDLIFTVIHSYANTLQDNQKTDLALENYKLALKMCLEQNRLEVAMEIYTSIGLLQLREKKYVQAEEVYHAIIELSKSVNSQRPITFLFFAKMNYYWENAEQVLVYLEKIKTESEQEVLDDFNIYRGAVIADDVDVYKEAADLYLALGKPEESALFYQKWGNLKNRLQAYTKKVQLSELEKLYFNERSKNQELEESRRSQANMGIAFIVILILAGGFTFYIRMRGLKENQRLKFTLKARQLEQLMEVQEAERQRIARELHDGIGQSLAALMLQLEFDDDEHARQVTVQRVDALCEEVRTLSHQMMPLVLKENGLKAAIKQLVDDSFSKPEIEADVVVNGMDVRLEDKVEVHLYRITQELISNILKHSKATKVGVQLLQRKDMVVLILEDNGKGFNIDKKFEGIGISNMRSRVEALSGTMKIQSSQEEGTYVYIAIPMAQQENRKTA